MRGLPVLAVLGLLAGCGGTSVSISGSGISSPSAATVKQWPRYWCGVRPGVTRQEAIFIMGKPTSQSTGANSQANWYAYGYGFSAFFDVNDRVRQLDWNPSQLTAAERSAIKCPETRAAR